MTSGPDVLVVGAGPTGLTLALQAHEHGARVRIVERRPEVFRPSRALIVHSRTLEVLRPLGVVDDLLARADTAPRACLHLGARRVPVRLGGFALPDTPFAHLSLIRQLDVETVLSQALAERGVPVERGIELTGLDRGERASDGVRVVLRSAKGAEATAYRFVVGCDGRDSTVRIRSGIAWWGRPYRQEVVLADLELRGDFAPGVAHVVAGHRGLVFVFAMGEQATWRMLATRPATAGSAPPGQSGPAVPAVELQRLLDEAGLHAQIADLTWSTSVRLWRGLADRYRDGAVFLAGDAAHVHSPAGGQGMNTGIQDAVNLGWKLAFAPYSSCPTELLDSYEQERRPVARLVCGLTDVAFWAESATDPVASFLRRRLVPLGAPVLPAILRRRRLVAHGVRLLSQLRLGYRGSPLSVGATPVRRDAPRAGDRLPDATVTVSGRPVRLHELTARPGVHVLLDRDAPEPPVGVVGPHVHVHRIDSTPGCGVRVVRPDGYIGYGAGAFDRAQVSAWLDRVGATSVPSGSAGLMRVAGRLPPGTGHVR